MSVETDDAQDDQSRSVLQRVWRGRADDRPRATWRLVGPLVVFVVVALIGGRLLDPLDFPPALLNAPGNAVVLIALVGCAITAKRLGDRSVRGLGIGPAWRREFAVGICFGLAFQAVVTVLWATTGELTVTDTLFPGGAPDAASVVVATVATLFAFLVVGVWEEFVFRGVLVRNVAEGLEARGSPPSTALLGAGTVSVVVFGVIHATGAAVALTSPVFAVTQAFASGVYFLLAYVLTGSLALPIGIHFATNVWVRTVVGEADGAFPALLVAERAAPAGIDAVVVLLPPFVLLIALVVGWAVHTGQTVRSMREAYRRVTATPIDGES